MLRFLVFLLFLLAPGLACAGTSDVGAYLADPSSFMPGASAADRQALAALYAARGGQKAWDMSTPDTVKRAQGFFDSIKAVIAYHGLDAGDYPVNAMRKLAATPNADRMQLEILISDSLLRLTRDLRGESVDLAAIYPGWGFHRAPADDIADLAAAIKAEKLGAFFDRIAPQDPAYAALATALKTYRGFAANGGWPTVGNGPILHPGDDDPRIAQLRARLKAEGYILPDGDQPDTYDDKLRDAVVDYQRRNGLKPDGVLGQQTVAALDVPVAARIGQICANMERWRHMPQDWPPANYVEVNIPDFSVKIAKDGQEIFRGAVVDGRTDRPTPFIDSKITNAVINPSWHVPVSIARKDILPKLKRDAHYLEKQGIVIAGRDQDPSGLTIDWRDLKPENFNYQLRQNPGDINSLGQIKFNFANAFSVYMHGTPHQELFDKAERDFSSGCVRLEDPLRVAEILLAANKGDWSEQKIQDEIDAGKTRFVPLRQPIPVYFTYWTVFADSSGRINFRKDIYGYDQLLINKFKNGRAGN